MVSNIIIIHWYILLYTSKKIPNLEKKIPSLEILDVLRCLFILVSKKELGLFLLTGFGVTFPMSMTFLS